MSFCIWHTMFHIQLIIFLGITVLSASGFASGNKRSSNELELNPLVVTGTRNERPQNESPIAVEVISSKELKNIGATELSQALAEVSGLQVIFDHGEGVQMEGFDSDYILILIDGEPIVGRTAGTFDINRINIQDVERIEIVRGPLSSQYGSDALAGTINIISKANTSPLVIHSKWSTLRERSKGVFGESFQSVRAGMGFEKLGSHKVSITIESKHEDGYDLVPEIYGSTANPIAQYAVTPVWKGTFGGFVYVSSTGKWYSEKSQYASFRGEDSSVFDNQFTQRDFSLNNHVHIHWMPILNKVMGVDWKYPLTTTLSSTYFQYKTWSSNTNFLFSDTIVNEFSSKSQFKQNRYKQELQQKVSLPLGFHAQFGFGRVLDKVKADRVENERYRSTDYFFNGQVEWYAPSISSLLPKTPMSLFFGIRKDDFSNYNGITKTRLSDVGIGDGSNTVIFPSGYVPTLSGKINAFSPIYLGGSYARGYKVPEYRQIALDFTNPTAGYSVFGTNYVSRGLQELDANGEITFIDSTELAKVTEIVPEESNSWRASVEWNTQEPAPWMQDISKDIWMWGPTFQYSYFQHNVSELIETTRVAGKSNLQSVFTYINISRVRMKGHHLKGKWKFPIYKWKKFPLRTISLEASYQNLVAESLEDIEKIKSGEVKRATDASGLDVKPIPLSDYGGLRERSRHSGNVKAQLTARIRNVEVTPNVRMIFRGRYGVFDENGNGVIDTDKEYAGGYRLYNTTWSFRFTGGNESNANNEFMKKMQGLSFHIGVENVTNYTSFWQPTLPGRKWSLYATYSM